MMAQYIVEVGLVDLHLCDEIPDSCNEVKVPRGIMKRRMHYEQHSGGVVPR